MFTDAAGNFTEAWSAVTTIQFLRRLSIGRRMNAAYDGDAMTNIRVYIQNPNYNVAVTKPARNADWGNPNQPEASRITLEMNRRIRVENMLYVEDIVENAVADYRSRLQRVSVNGMQRQYEDDLVAYMLGLSSDFSGNAAAQAARNGNAGPIFQIAYPAGTGGGTGFDPGTGKPVGTATQMAATRKWVLDFLTDARVRFERTDVHLDGSNVTVGGMSQGAWCAMPIELFVYGVADALEDKGFDLPWMTRLLRDLGVFGMALAGHYRGFDLFVTNSLPKPANAAGVWQVLAGSDMAVAAPARPFRNYIRTPENAQAERYEFRHNQTFGRALANSNLLIRGNFNAGSNVEFAGADGEPEGPTTAHDVLTGLADLLARNSGAHDLRGAAQAQADAPGAADAATDQRDAEAEAQEAEEAEQAAPKPRSRSRKS